MYVDAARGWAETPVYHRERLPVGVDIAGPRDLQRDEHDDPGLPGQTARIDAWGNLIVRIAHERPKLPTRSRWRSSANRLLAIAEDMGSILIRSSFSSNIKERRDCATALFDARGGWSRRPTTSRSTSGAMIGAVRGDPRRYKLEDCAPGDAFICNDPYLAGGSHLPDISIITPMHHDGQVRFFAGNIAHHADVGGRTPGSTSGTSRSIFEEGIRLPVIRIARGGDHRRGPARMIAHNTRDPRSACSTCARPDRHQRARRRDAHGS
jgi:hypothetical protein